MKTQTKIFLHNSSLIFFKFSSSLPLEYGCTIEGIGP